MYIFTYKSHSSVVHSVTSAYLRLHLGRKYAAVNRENEERK